MREMAEKDNNLSHRRRLVQKAKEYHFRDVIPPEEYEALVEMLPELINPSCESQHLILGSYSSKKKGKLLQVKEELNTRDDTNCRGYLLEDFPDGLHPILQFKLIVEHSDSIIGVCEHDQGGFQVELGMIVALTKYFDDCWILKRTYDDEREFYSWMLTSGVFEMFEYEDRLWEWRTDEGFETAVGDVLSKVV